MGRTISAGFLLIVLSFLPCTASAFEVVAEPVTLRPGDPFVVKVLSNPHEPEARVEGVGGAGLNFAPCGEGCFIAVGAVALDAEPGELKVTVRAGGESRTLSIMVEEVNFPIQHLTLPESQVTLGPEDEERAEREAEALRAAWSRVTERLWDGGFIMPLDNGFSTAFGVKRIINGHKESVHRGVDIRGSHGEEVRAANRGVVVLVLDTFYGGNTLVLDHGLGVFTIYMHMSAVKVMKRELLSKGDVIGLVGSTGRSTGPHLHYGVKVGGASTNPVSMAGLQL
jgi:murein DD-endopeptidase MepM/ murein hydrolase activator NlpD